MRRALLALTLSLAACASIPRPAVMAEVADVQAGPVAKEAKTYAPQAAAHAEDLARQADAAFARGDTSGAELLGERALAAWARAAVLSRIARADAASAEADAKLAEATKELAALDADQGREGAEADALELKVKVARDAQPIQPSGKADPEREKARREAAKALTLEAKLLCAGARLLGSEGDVKRASQIDEATRAVEALEAKLKEPTATPIDEATRARAGCLAALTLARRAATSDAKAPGAGDALLAELSAGGALAPARDDRGVVVTLRGIVQGKGLSAAGEAKIADLARVAAAHPKFPVEIVVHGAGGKESDDDERAIADAIAKKLGDGKSLKITSVVAGSALPVVDPRGPDKAKNARVEIVFVSPEAL